MKTFLKFFFASTFGFIVGFFICFFLTVGLVFFSLTSSPFFKSAEEVTSISPKSFLTLKFNKSYPEKSMDISSLFQGQSDSFHSLNKSIELASSDEDIEGIVLLLDSYSLSLAQTQSLRSSLKKFKDKNKKIYAFASNYKEKSYYLASLANEIYLHPTGYFEWNGFGVQPTFYKGFMDKFHIEPKVYKAGSFKSGAEPYVSESLGENNREQLQELVDDFWSVLISDLSKDRNLSEDSLENLAQSFSIQTPDQALSEGLVDGLQAYSSFVEGILFEDKDPKTITEKDYKRLVTLEKYSANTSNTSLKKILRKISSGGSAKITTDSIVVLVADGAIVGGEGGESYVGADSFIRSILKAKYNEHVKAVVLRINSPGGGSLASDRIWAELKALNALKPVYVSFGSIAASGGYYIAAAAEKIYAEPTTITGSIGVYAVLLNIKKAAKKNLGLSFDRVVTHPFADIMSATRPSTEQEDNLVQQSILRTYDDFLNVVKEGRNFKTIEEVDNIAQGRVWTGKKALEIGLVDELGDIYKTIEDLKIAIEMPDINVVYMDEDYGFQNMVDQWVWSKTPSLLKDHSSIIMNDWLHKEKILMWNPYTKLEVN